VLTTILAVIGSATGVVGLGLSIMNTRHNIGAETRARQRERQAELRQLLLGIESEADELGKPLDYGQDVPPVGEFVMHAKKRLEDLATSLERPSPQVIRSAASEVSSLNIFWGGLRKLQAELPASASGPKPESWFAMAAKTREARDAARDQIKVVLYDLSAIDKGQ
jgi:hypothetical protein